MFSKQLQIILSFFMVFETIKAANDISCIDATPMKNFNLDRYLGLKYQFANNDEKLHDFDCVRILFVRHNGQLAAIRLWKDKSDNSINMELKSTSLDETGQGKSLDGFTKTVVGTDYESYLVTFACEEKSNRLVVWISGLTPNISDLNLNAITDILNKYNLQFSDFDRVDQDSCPNDWSDAKVHEVDFKFDEEIKQDLKAAGLIKD